MSWQTSTTRVDELIARKAARSLLQELSPKERVDIVEWVPAHVDCSVLPTSAETGPMRFRPYQVEPARETENPEVQEITLCWGQRLGKSTVWQTSLLKRALEGHCAGLVVYQNKEYAESTNRDFVLPLFESQHETRADLAMRGNKLKDSYHIPSTGSVIYFLGGGAQIIGRTANFTIMDEADFIQTERSDAEGANTSQIRALRLRMQTYRERLLLVCSSPTMESGTVFSNWTKGSQGRWNLRCLHCGGLYPCTQLAWLLPDGTYAGLQWRKTEQGDVIEESIRWICPNCKHPHVEADAPRMNELGAYVHNRDARRHHRSYQCGALANPHLWTWLEIAEAQEAATDPDGKKYLCNTVLGTPYKHVREGDPSVSIDAALDAKHTDLPADLATRLAVVVGAADQQKSELAGEKYYVFVIRGWDEDGNSWLLKHGIANSLDSLDAHFSADYYGQKPALCIIDQGGFDNTLDLDPFVASHPRYLYYKGEDDRTLKGHDWIPSGSNQKLYLASAIRYQVRLLSLLYDPPRPVGYRWNLPPETSVDYMEQLSSVRPNSRMVKDGNGEAYQNWCATGKMRRDYFDAEKMALVCLDLACHFIPPEQWAHKNKPLFKRREWIAELKRQQQLNRK